MTGNKLSIFSHPGKITDYWITSRSFPYRGPYFVSGQYGCLFSRCRKYVINSLIHGHFHIGLVIIHRPILGSVIISFGYLSVTFYVFLYQHSPKHSRVKMISIFLNLKEILLYEIRMYNSTF
jgi:hypothetical protein